MPTLDEVRERYPNTPEGLERVREAVRLILLGCRGYNITPAIAEEFGREARKAWLDGDCDPAAIHASLWPPEPERKAVADMTLLQCVVEGEDLTGFNWPNAMREAALRNRWDFTLEHRAAILAAELAKGLPFCYEVGVQNSGDYFWAWVTIRAYPEQHWNSGEKRNCSTPSEAMLRALLDYEREKGE